MYNGSELIWRWEYNGSEFMWIKMRVADRKSLDDENCGSKSLANEDFCSKDVIEWSYHKIKSKLNAMSQFVVRSKMIDILQYG